MKDTISSVEIKSTLIYSFWPVNVLFITHGVLRKFLFCCKQVLHSLRTIGPSTIGCEWMHYLNRSRAKRANAKPNTERSVYALYSNNTHTRGLYRIRRYTGLPLCSSICIWDFTSQLGVVMYAQVIVHTTLRRWAESLAVSKRLSMHFDAFGGCIQGVHSLHCSSSVIFGIAVARLWNLNNFALLLVQFEISINVCIYICLPIFHAIFRNVSLFLQFFHI